MSHKVPKRFASATLELLNREQFQPVIDFSHGKLDRDKGLLVCGPPGVGKCLGEGTRVLKYDGTTVRVEDVREGDALLGPDGKRRFVHSVSAGHGPLYRIVPVKGKPWVCNYEHVLTLIGSESKEVVDIPLREYLRLSAWKKQHLKLFIPEEVTFKPRAAPKGPSPYFIGIWLGDGTKRLDGVSVSKPDAEIEQACRDEAEVYGLRVVCSKDEYKCPTWSIRGDGSTGGNRLLSDLQALMAEGACVPPEYLYADVPTRAAVLAGLLDTDGYLANKCFELVQRSKRIAKDAAFLARSLGIRVTEKKKVVNGVTYQRLFLSGDMTRLPLRIARKIPKPRKQQKNARVTGFSVEAIGDGDYFGFTLDGDGRFLLGDFTVTHNTWALAALTTRWLERGLVRNKARSFEFVTAPTFFANLDPFSDDAWDHYRDAPWQTTYNSVEWLVINDLGKEDRQGKLASQKTSWLGRVLRARCEDMKVTHITTNLNGREIKEAYGDSIASLLSEMTIPVIVDGSDRRKQ